MLLTLLAFYERASVFVKNVWEDTKAAARIWLGPAPQNLLLLADGTVIPADISIPDVIRNTAYLYHVDNQQITSANAAVTAEGRFRRLPYVAISTNHPIVGSTDISDWLGEIRANPVPSLNPKQILLLWSAVHRIYIPFSGGLQVSITKSDGTDDTIHYD